MAKTIYVEQILHDFQLSGVGCAYTSKKKAAEHIRKIKSEQSIIRGFSIEDLWIVYEINNTVIQINFQETDLL